MNKNSVQIRRAEVTDAKSIKRLIDIYSVGGSVLPRSLQEIYVRIRDFWVAEESAFGVVGCVALQIMWEDLAEVRTLVVNPESQSKGIGKRLVITVLEEAQQLRLKRVFALTEIPAFFTRLGFFQVEMDVLPQKVFYDCIHCPKVDHCNEVALIYNCPESPSEKPFAKEESPGLQSVD